MLFKSLKIRELVLLFALLSAGTAFASTGGGISLPYRFLSRQGIALD